MTRPAPSNPHQCFPETKATESINWQRHRSILTSLSAYRRMKHGIGNWSFFGKYPLDTNLSFLFSFTFGLPIFFFLFCYTGNSERASVLGGFYFFRVFIYSGKHIHLPHRRTTAASSAIYLSLQNSTWLDPGRAFSLMHLQPGRDFDLQAACTLTHFHFFLFFSLHFHRIGFHGSKTKRNSQQCTMQLARPSPRQKLPFFFLFAFSIPLFFHFSILFFILIRQLEAFLWCIS